MSHLSTTNLEPSDTKTPLDSPHFHTNSLGNTLTHQVSSSDIDIADVLQQDLISTRCDLFNCHSDFIVKASFSPVVVPAVALNLAVSYAPPLPAYVESSCFSIRAESHNVVRQLWKSIRQYLSDQGMVVAESSMAQFELHCSVFSGVSICEFHIRLYSGRYSHPITAQLQQQENHFEWLTVELQRRSGCLLLFTNQIRKMLEWLRRTNDFQIETAFAALDAMPGRAPACQIHADILLYTSLYDLMCSQDENTQLEGLNALSVCLQSATQSFLSSSCAHDIWIEMASLLRRSESMSVTLAAAKLFEAAAMATICDPCPVTVASEIHCPNETVAKFDPMESLMNCFPAIIARLQTSAGLSNSTQSSSSHSPSQSSHSTLPSSPRLSMPSTSRSFDEACRKQMGKCLLRGCTELYSALRVTGRLSPLITSQDKQQLLQLCCISNDADVHSLAQVSIRKDMQGTT